MKKALKILNIAVVAVLALILCINLFFVVSKLIFKNDLPKLFGVTGAVVISGSMEPTISVGDVVVIKEQESYCVDDVVTYRTGSLVTHRIIEQTQNGFITKGDWHENSPDDEITASQIEGKVVLTVPSVGYVIDFMKTPLGTLVIVTIGFALIAVPDMIRNARENKNAKQ